MKIKYILIIALVFIFASCQKMKYDKEYNWAYPVSGDWTIKAEYGATIDGPFSIKTFNSSFGQDSIWIDDNHNYWPFKVKAAVNMKTLTFSTTNYVSYPGTATEDVVTITNAQIIKTDSIYFEAQFASDPGTVYKMYGHRKTSYEEYNGL